VKTFLLALPLCLLLAAADPPLAAPPADYSNDFQKVEEGPLPPELLVLNGEFEIRKDGDEKFIHLAGEPLDTFGILLGTDQHTSVAASIRASKTGRRFPEIGVGLCGAGGYRLWIMPAINELQIKKGDDKKLAKPYQWKDGSWTNFRLQLRKQDGKIHVEGKVWERGTPEPKEWMITLDDAEAAPKGRPTVWGIPYSGTPIHFDDLAISTAK
jgi:hypothetical protein